jgi:hypothetical protein
LKNLKYLKNLKRYFTFEVCQIREHGKNEENKQVTVPQDPLPLGLQTWSELRMALG